MLFDVQFKWIGGATWTLSLDGFKLACDPVLCPMGKVQKYGFGMVGKRLTAPGFDADDFRDVDLWLISHEHKDHIDSDGLSQIDPNAPCVTNRGAAARLRKIGPRQLMILEHGQTVSLEIKDFSLEIEAIPAVHASNRLASHFAGRGNGYWLTLKKGPAKTSIYVTGDTVCHAKVTRYLANRTADILIPNLGKSHIGKFGSPYTLSAEGLHKVVDLVRPRLVFPVHHSSFSHMNGEPISRVSDWKDERVKVLREGESFRLAKGSA
ncbi:MAG: MBL fold metallo-hydrolase [Solirubrobacterales bacterium]